MPPKLEDRPLMVTQLLNLMLNLMLITGPQAGERLDGQRLTLGAVA